LQHKQSDESHGNVSATVGVTSNSHADRLPLASSLAQKQDARLA
jgi:hypothetical protein